MGETKGVRPTRDGSLRDRLGEAREVLRCIVDGVGEISGAVPNCEWIWPRYDAKITVGMIRRARAIATGGEPK